MLRLLNAIQCSSSTIELNNNKYIWSKSIFEVEVKVNTLLNFY